MNLHDQIIGSQESSVFLLIICVEETGVDHGSKPFNIKVVHCENEDIFWNTSVSALNMWLYSGIKKITEYSKEPTNGLEATFKYQLSDVQQ